MVVSLNTQRKQCMRSPFLRTLGKGCFTVVLILLAFIGGYFMNPNNRLRLESKGKAAEMRNKRDLKAEDFQRQLLDSFKAENLEENLRYFSKEPHFAGSKRNYDLAQNVSSKWREYAFDKVDIAEYSVLLSYPRKGMKNKVEIYNNGDVVFQAQSQEKPLHPDERKASEVPIFLEFSPSGVAQGEVVYANFGNKEDYQELEKLNISLKDKIVIVRQGRVFRGNKVYNAASYGAAGVLIFTDPETYAPQGTRNTFPHSWWLPDSGVQRGSTLSETGPGDPRTPGFPAVDGIYRRPINESGLPTIPAYEISYGDAREILRRMKGQEAPKSWQGKLQIPYRLGPGFHDPNISLRMEVNTKFETKTIYNVIGQIRGTEEPDRYVLMGNHRDAWVFGAADAVSGTSILMEVSRGLGELLKVGWRPRRTIMLCSWDGEELLIVGSTEWVEENAKVLQDRAIAYLNMDVAVNGNFSLNVDATPLLQETAVSLTKDVCDPTVSTTCKSMFDVMLERDVTKHINGTPFCDNLSFGSDFAAFYHFIGVSSADWAYIFGGIPGTRRSYPMYHSAHDTYHWMKTFVDPEFQTHLAVAKYAGIFLLNLTESPLLPFNTSTYADLIRSESISLEKDSRLKAHQVSMAAFSRAVNNFAKAAREFEKWKKEAKVEDFRVLNEQMMQVEKAFIQTIEVNDPKQLRHVIYAPNLLNLYGGLYFPRLRHAIAIAEKMGNWEQVKKEVSLLTYSINSASKVIEII